MSYPGGKKYYGGEAFREDTIYLVPSQADALLN